jgi:hypothetical protein
MKTKGINFMEPKITEQVVINLTSLESKVVQNVVVNLKLLPFWKRLYAAYLVIFKSQFSITGGCELSIKKS